MARLEDAGAKALHLDVMDGHFVPNLTYGLTIVEAIRKRTERPIDAHLMIGNPAEYVERYVDAGADSVTIHVEAIDDPTSVLETIRNCGAAAGLALNPPTPAETVYPYMPLCDLVLVMSVMPGFGGQAFDASALEKLTLLARRRRDTQSDGCPMPCDDRRAKEHARSHAMSPMLQVDGGVNEQTIGRCAASGADLFVVGSAIFGYDDYQGRIQTLTRVAACRDDAPAAHSE